MPTLRLAAIALLLVLAAVPLEVSAQPAGFHYTLTLDCGASLPVGQPASPVTTGGGGCPIRAVDGDDLMGDPSLAVDPLRPEDLILASLHGQSAEGSGPSAKSRTGQVFTTFTSVSQGQSWVDNPFTPPDDIGFAYGIHPQVTIDPYGQVYVGSLYAVPNGQDGNGTDTFQYVVAAQKFESIGTIDEEQFSSSGGYNAEYITPVHEGNQIDQMWFLFNPVTDNMTMVWRETVPKPPVPPCDNDSSYLLNVTGYYVKADATGPGGQVYQESNGKPGLQTEASCPTDPDDLVVGSLAPAPVQPLAAAPVPPTPATAVPGTMRTVTATLEAAAAPAPAAFGPVAHGLAAPPTAPHAAAAAPVRVSDSSWDAALARDAQAQPDDEEDAPAVGAIGVVWTTSDSDTPYYYQDLDDAIQPCATSTNPVLYGGWLYIGCVVDTSQGTFRWAPDARNGTVHLFRMDPNGGKPAYMGQAPDMVGVPKLGVRSDGRLALVAAGTSDEGALRLSAAFGEYDQLTLKIEWTTQLSVGDDVLPANPELLIVRAEIQDMIYREQSGALHLILKTTVDYVGGSADVLDGAGLAPHIQKVIVALDERYGFLATLPLEIGDPLQRQADTTIATSPEAAFQDLSDDFLQLPAEPFTYNGKKLGDLYQREFFAIADYGTVLFAEVIEDTTIQAPALQIPPAPPPPVPAAATTNLVAPVAGIAGIGALMSTLVAHRRKNPLAAYVKG